MAKKSKVSDNNLLRALLYAVIGVLFCIFKGGILDVLLTIAGVLFIVYGIIECINKNILNAVVYIVLGALIIAGGWLFVEIVLVIFGALLIVSGIMDLGKVAKSKKTVNFLAPIVTIVVGVLLILSHWIGMLNWLFIVLGVMFIINAILLLFGIKR